MLFASLRLSAQTFTYKMCDYSIISDNAVTLVSFQAEKNVLNEDILFLDSIAIYKKKRYKVVKIEQNAFQPHSNMLRLFLNSIRQVQLPKTLKEISANVFQGHFVNLQSIVFPHGIKIIGDNSFANLPSLTEVRIGGINRISDWCFSLNPSLSNVHMDTCVHAVGHNSFFKCTRLNRINLENVRCVGEHAFEGTSIELLNIPNCRTIDEFAFAECYRISDIVFANNLHMIGDFAFWGNTALKSLKIFSGSIGESAFMACSSLLNVNLFEAVNSIGQAAFLGCSALREVAIPSSISRIEAMTFMDCINLRSITLPNSITFIGESAFENSGLEELTIPSAVVEIQTHAFRNCNKLRKVKLLNPDVEIGVNAFDDNILIEYSK